MKVLGLHKRLYTSSCICDKEFICGLGGHKQQTRENMHVLNHWLLQRQGPTTPEEHAVNRRRGVPIISTQGIKVSFLPVNTLFLTARLKKYSLLFLIPTIKAVGAAPLPHQD